MILIIKLCKQKMHNLEFVKPIRDILKKNYIKYITIFYKEVNKKILLDVDKVIISGTSLFDNDFAKNSSYFHWIKKFKKPILGICGGFQILGLIYNGNRIKSKKIGLSKIKFYKEFLGLEGEIEVYELHNYSIHSNDYEIYAISDKCPEAIKHKNLPFYGVLFHPEVRNKDMIINFTNL